MGAVTAIRLLAAMAAAPLGGTLLDRTDRRAVVGAACLAQTAWVAITRRGVRPQ